MRGLARSAVVSCLLSVLSAPAMAICTDEQKLGEVLYANNSSYFSSEDARHLDEIKQLAMDKKDGYLLLEFNVFAITDNEKLRHYNLWLAKRRIERVKHYLNTEPLPVPIITRIRTASSQERRDVDILWCESSAISGNSANHY
ncbi:hypothetical protein [Shewanella sp. YIC-542]|uniref:hypothetical protein n=1 Tax=Shewanella mytili TaxID=3377111 RepID=UPI00398F455D